MNESDRTWVGSMPDSYERGLGATVFAPFAKDLASRATRFGGRRVLELAAGTGVLTAELITELPGSQVVATDLNEAMVALGAERVPGASWRTADAMDLPFDDAAFDLVACQFGVMFFPDKPAAFSEVRRVLAVDGVCLVNVWGRLEDHAFQLALVAACDQLFPADPPTFVRLVPHHYADADALVADIEAGGLRVLDVAHVTLESPPASPRDVAAGYCFGTPVRSEIEARGGDPGAVVSAVAAEIEARLGPAPVRGRMTAHVVAAGAT